MVAMAGCGIILTVLFGALWFLGVI